MNPVPESLCYTPAHTWLRAEADGTLTVGITHHAQEMLGDIVFVELPDAGTDFAAGAQTGVVESVKSASDIHTPVAGRITAVNDDLATAPETVNSDPYGAGWFFKILPADPAALDSFLTADQYAVQIG
ncbi:glycine cleavage system protein H [Neisseria chenwenguii]|uniref:Glycine cleavage system H protein n=2 Tax=Neisseria chenwenguii TaxID=1853278 RepID=A0A220S515_9NEIS|nr:glycine cleavage system protein GcvH [Neisseria chenwenguii]ASK28532.1 glycine cleavage system protein H [Neisseria chenwenguii]ROV56299.1 glycine cleavage system protein GcvH [Neisseria chenwenguii]